MKQSPIARSPKRNKTTSLQRRLERHFVTCSAAVGAAAALTPMQEAQAQIVFHAVNVQVPLNSTSGVYINIETGQVGFEGSQPPGWDLNLFNPDNFFLNTFDLELRTRLIGNMVVGPYDTYRYASRLNAGANIGDNIGAFLAGGGYTTLAFSGTPPAGEWLGNTSGFLGVQFRRADLTLAFAWIQLEVTNSTSARITGFAYETSGGAIVAGAVPEPSSVALCFLAAGAGGLALWRRRRAEAAKAA